MEARLLGKWGEQLVAEDLRKKGWRIVEVNYRCRHGEVDIIAANRTFLAFVEVKLRSAGSIALPREFVDSRKQQKLRAAAAAYLSTHGLDAAARFDVAEVYTETNGGIRVEYLENAFE